MRLSNEGEMEKVLIEFGDEGKVKIWRILSNMDSLKATNRIPYNKIWIFWGKIVKKILSKFEHFHFEG